MHPFVALVDIFAFVDPFLLILHPFFELVALLLAFVVCGSFFCTCGSVFCICGSFFYTSGSVFCIFGSVFYTSGSDHFLNSFLCFFVLVFFCFVCFVFFLSFSIFLFVVGPISVVALFFLCSGVSRAG